MSVPEVWNRPATETSQRPAKDIYFHELKAANHLPKLSLNSCLSSRHNTMDTRRKASLQHLHSFQLMTFQTAFMMLSFITRAFLILHSNAFSCYFQWPEWTWLCHTDLFCFHIKTWVFLFKFSASPSLSPTLTLKVFPSAAQPCTPSTSYSLTKNFVTFEKTTLQNSLESI